MIPFGSQAISIERLYTRIFIYNSPLFQTNCVVYFHLRDSKLLIAGSQEHQGKNED
jgi:hypothetical protein